MSVFNLSMKIIKKNLGSMMMYVVIFLAITIIFAAQTSNQAQTDFTAAKINMAFINEENTPLMNGFKEKFSEYANFVDLEDTNEALQDALFFRDVEYILRIPAGFTQSIMTGKNDVQLLKTTLPSSSSSAYMDITIDQYFNTARLYVDGLPNITQEQIVTNLKKDLAYHTPVEFQDKELSEQNHIFAKNYFNYLTYSLFTVLILGISAIMLVLNDKDKKKRNACAPVSKFRMNLEFLLAHFCFTFASWVVMMIFYFIFDFKNSGSTHTLYFMLNSFIFALCGSSISFFIGNLVKNRNALSAISNVVTLGPCFISGIFVPQELLGATVLKVASFTPTYWYAKANEVISTLTTFDNAHLQPVIISMLIQVGFAVAFLTVSLVLNKRNKLSY